MRNKTCEISITLTGYSAEEVVLKLAEYVNDGFRIVSSSMSARAYNIEYQFDLVKYD